MDRISGLSDELLIKILSFLPTKTAASTSILSKQWEFLWMWLPKLEYSTKYGSKADCEKLRRFLHRNLPLHRAPVLESFRLKFSFPHFTSQDIKPWVLAVVSRRVRDLKIYYVSYPNAPDILPSSLYTCKSLVTLKLKGSILVNVPLMVSFPCLKTLRLQNVTYLNEDSFQRLLSNCPVLEDLLVYDRDVANLRKLTVTVSSLLRLVLCIRNDVDEFVVNTPSLKYLKLTYSNSKSHHFLVEKMPELKEASLDVSFPYIKKLIRSITSVKLLKLCLGSSEGLDVYGDGLVFNELEHLKICICKKYASSVLVRLLKDSPNLRVLDLGGLEDEHKPNGVPLWNRPSTVPECILSSLHTFKFFRYLGTRKERDVATYILQNAHCLTSALITFQSCMYEELDIMIKQLTRSPPASTTCKLMFI